MLITSIYPNIDSSEVDQWVREDCNPFMTIEEAYKKGVERAKQTIRIDIPTEIYEKYVNKHEHH